MPPPEVGSDSEDSLGDPEHVSSIKLLYEDGVPVAWLVANIRCTDDIVMTRIPAWAGDNATSCNFPRQVQNSSMMETEYSRLRKMKLGACALRTSVERVKVV